MAFSVWNYGPLRTHFGLKRPLSLSDSGTFVDAVNGYSATPARKTSTIAMKLVKRGGTPCSASGSHSIRACLEEKMIWWSMRFAWDESFRRARIRRLRNKVCVECAIVNGVLLFRDANMNETNWSPAHLAR